MPNEPYRILQVQPEWVLEPEALGSKEKFWYREPTSAPEQHRIWLFKYPQPNTGQHWAEKIAEEVADALRLIHGRVELAEFQGVRGSVTESFAREGRELYHGNQILAGRVLGYDPGKAFRQSEHTFANILAAVDALFFEPDAARIAKIRLCGYFVLDAVIGNTDRHHENWGILRKRVGTGWVGLIAPSYDHASSLGRELVDESEGKCRRRLLEERRVGAYSEKAPGAIYWERTDKKGLSPLELVRRASRVYPELFRSGLESLTRLDRAKLEELVQRVPGDWMSSLARAFAVELMWYNLGELRKLSSP